MDADLDFVWERLQVELPASPPFEVAQYAHR